jgi:beta-lactamase regulating signal transducer with metallopeptidase domain
MLELAVRSTVILLVAWVLTRLMSRASAAARHLVWHAAIVATLAAPFVAPIAVVLLAQVPQVTTVPQVPEVLNVLGAVEVPALLRERPSAADTQRAISTSSTLRTLGTVGCLATLLWFAAGWIAAARLTRRSNRAPASWQLELNVLRDRMCITRKVRLGIIDGPTSPLATGLWHAAILLPRLALSWSSERRQAVLLHELAHIRRRDCGVQLLAQAACALYWFNPLVWIAAAHLRRERERACDDEVLRLGAQPSSYALHLLDIARHLHPTIRPSAALAMARPSELEGRLLAVLATNRARVASRASRWAIATTVTLTTVVALGATSAATSTGTRSAGTTRRYIAGLEPMVEEDRLATMRDRSTAERTLEQSSDPQDRERAVLTLAFSSGRDVIPALLEALGDADSQVREKAAIGLALRRDERVVNPLLAAMNDPDSQVREKVAIALGTSGDLRAGAALTRALDDPDSQVREKATAALILLGLTGQ